MRKESFHFEIKDLITHFISAFDDIVIRRYNKTRSVVDKINVRYVYGPKQRVLHDLINKSQHITLPVVAVSISSLSRDEDRVFNKLFGYYDANDSNRTTSTFIPQPVPVNISINMSILTKFQTDMDQIVSNFIPYTNPYIVISWKLPSDISSDIREIRSEVTWSGDISIDYPSDLQNTQPARVSADTTFTIKGWLFPAVDTSTVKNILYINTHISPVTGFDYI